MSDPIPQPKVEKTRSRESDELHLSLLTDWLQHITTLASGGLAATVGLFSVLPKKPSYAPAVAIVCFCASICLALIAMMAAAFMRSQMAGKNIDRDALDRGDERVFMWTTLGSLAAFFLAIVSVGFYALETVKL